MLRFISTSIFRGRAHKRAFTLTELLVVIAIIAMLIALVLVGFAKAKLLSKVASCLSNQRQLALAQASYATDNGGAYVSNRTSGFTQTNEVSFTLNNTMGSFPILLNKGVLGYDKYHSWTASFGSSVVAGSEKEYKVNSNDSTAKALSGGRLFSYIGSTMVYASPLDPTINRSVTDLKGRIRSYSFSSFVGGLVPEDSQEWANKWHTWFANQFVSPREWKTTHVANHRFPSQTLMSVVEDDSDGFAFNNQGWCIDPRPPLGSIAPLGTPNPGAWANSGGWEGWIDWPALWNPKNITYSYVDGSTESYSLQKPGLVSLIQGPPGAGFGHRYPQPGDTPGDPLRRDWMHFRERLCPGMIPPMIPRYQQ